MARTACLSLLALAAGLVASCARPHPEIVRMVAGEPVVGPLISPFAYASFVEAERLRLAGDLEGAVAQYERARLGPTDDPFVIARLAETLEALGRSREADAAIAEGLAIDPDSESIWLAKGRIAERRGAPELALEAYQKAADVSPESDAPVAAIATLLRQEGARDRALALLATYADRASSPSAAWLRFEIAVEEGDPRAAFDAVRALVEVAPARASEIRRAAAVALGHGRPDLAMRLLEPLPPTREDAALRVRTWIAAGRGSDAEALLAVTDADALGGPLAKAALYLDAGLADHAAEAAALEVELRPSPEAFDVAGRAALARGEHVRAAEALGHVPPGTRPFVEARIAMAEALRAAGLATLAEEVLAQGLRAASAAEHDALEAGIAALRERWGATLAPP